MPSHVGDSVGMAGVYQELRKTGFNGETVNVIWQKIEVPFAMLLLIAISKMLAALK